MKLRLKKLTLGAGRPIAFINEKNASELNVHIGDRVEIFRNSNKLVALVDLARDFIKKGEIALSEEIFNYLNLKDGEMIDVRLALGPKSSFYIAKKLSGKKLTKNEITEIMKDTVNNALTEAEIAYFVSGVYENGMTEKETIYLTEAIYKTGQIISWNGNKIADKHSIGGIAGNRTTPIIVPICAAAGIIMPKTSSRAITSASGTADAIETIANVDFPVSRLKEIVKKTGACLAWGGSLGLAPADDKLIKVERLLNLDPESQLIASILAKKLAVGSKYVLIDIPYGPGAKVNKEKAISLKEKFIRVGRHFKLKLNVVLTDGRQPIGNGIGPALEMIDVIKVLKRKDSPVDLEKKSVMLAGILLEMVGKAKKGEGIKKAQKILDSGQAYKKFEEIISAQGRKRDGLKPAKFSHDIRAASSGRLVRIDNHHINIICRILGSPADKGAGIYLKKHINEEVKKGEVILTFYSESARKLRQAVSFFDEENPVYLLHK